MRCAGLVALAALTTGTPLLADALANDFAIVVPAAETGGVAPHLASAGRVLARTVLEGAGWEIPVVTAPLKGRKAIFLGLPFAQKAGLLPAKPLKDFDNVIAVKDGNVYLFGHDRTARDKLKPSWTECLLPTVKALTNFMELYMDVRFLAPGDVGTDVPKFDRISVPDGTFRRENPTFDAGTGRSWDAVYSIANNIFGAGAYHTFGGHTYLHAVPVEKYGERHPEYFAFRGGSRKPERGNPALCISNPAVKRLLVDKLVEILDSGAETVELGQNDGGAFCECGKCRALYGLGADEQGEKIWRFHAEVAADVYRRCPDKTVQIISYGKTQDPPRTFRKFPPNVMIEMMTTTPKAFRRWSEYEVPRGFTAYVYLWGQWPLPGLTAKRSFAGVAAAARRMVGGGVRSIYRCGYGELFGTEGPAYYVYNKLLGDANLDVDALVVDYCTHAFGPDAAKPMLAFFRRLDSRLRAFDKMEEGFDAPGDTLKGISACPKNPSDLLAYIYTPETVAALESSLAKAEAVGLSGKRRIRLALVRKEFDYAKKTAAICHLYNANVLSPGEASFEVLAKAVAERNAFIDALYDDNGKMRRFPDWPEVPVFGNMSKPVLKENGQITARLGAPFGWDMCAMRARNAQGGGRRRLAVRRASGPVTIADDGFVSGAWKGVASVDMNGIQLEPTSVKCGFKALYDDRNLYLGVTTTMSDAIRFKPLGRDGACFRNHCIEVFIDPWGTREKHYHLICNPVENSFADEATGFITDTLDPKYGLPDISWNGDWTYESRRNNGLWHVLITIPFRTLGVVAPKSGDVYAFNLGRETPTKAGGELLLWSPNFKTRQFDCPETFGDLVFE